MYKRDETFNSNEIANGVLACLVAVTGCCPFIDPPWALLIGGDCIVYVCHYITVLLFLFVVLTILFYHLGCYIVYLLKLYDGARVFPVHGVWLVFSSARIIMKIFLFSGFWGVMCVGIFSQSCLIREVYETLCFCEDLTLPDRVSISSLGSHYPLCVFIAAEDSRLPFLVPVSWRTIYCCLVSCAV